MLKMQTDHKLYKNPGSAGGKIFYISSGESLGQQGIDFYYEVIDIVHLALIDISTSCVYTVLRSTHPAHITEKDLSKSRDGVVVYTWFKCRYE